MTEEYGSEIGGSTEEPIERTEKSEDITTQTSGRKVKPTGTAGRNSEVAYANVDLKLEYSDSSNQLLTGQFVKTRFF